MLSDEIANLCASGNKERLCELLEGGEDDSLFTKKTADGKTPLEVASCFGRLEIIEELVKNGARIDLTSERGNKPTL